MELKENMIHKKAKELEYLSFQLLNDWHIVNAFTLKGHNFRNQEGMEKEYQSLCHELNIPFQCLVKPTQKHTNHVLTIRQKQNQDTADMKLSYLEGIDGLITNQKNIALATTSADCLCIVLYDIQKHVLANIHSGWRGTFQKIVQNGVQKMKHEFQCEGKDIFAFFMPAIRQCHFEVEDDVMEECKRIFKDTHRLEEIIQIGRVVDGVQKYHIDNILLNRIMLEDEGVLSEHILDAGICSVCDSDKIHSRRAEGEEFGLGTTVVMIS